MIRQFSLAALVFQIAGCGGADLPPRYHELQQKFHELEPNLVAIEQEMEKDALWQLVPHYVDGSVNEPHIPELTSGQIAKYRNLLGLVPVVDYVDKTNDRTDFSLGWEKTDHRHFTFQFIHTTRRPRPANCNESGVSGTSGVCSSDLGNNWALWVGWAELADEVD